MWDYFGARIRVSRLGRLQLRVDFLAGDGIENAGDDNALLRLQSALHHLQLADGLAERHPALLHNVIGVDRQHVAPSLIAAHCHRRD